MCDKGTIILRMCLFLTNSVCIIIFNVQYTTTGSLKPLFLLDIGGMDTKYPNPHKFNFKFYLFPVIPEIFLKCDDTTVDSIMVNYEAKNMTVGTGNSKSVEEFAEGNGGCEPSI